MMTGKLSKSKRAEHFNSALLVIIISIAVVSTAFLTENRNLTGLVVNEEKLVIEKPNLIVFDDVSSLRALAAGNYYVDGDSIVYWADDDSMPAVAKVNFIGESQKNRKIHIDNEGNIGYLFE